MKWTCLTRLLVALLVSLAVAPALYAQALDLNDNFDDGVLDSEKWCACANNGSVEETGGKLVLTVNSNDVGQEFGETVWSRYRLHGALDIQVDYELLEWPPHNRALLALSADPRDDYNALERLSGTAGECCGTDELYVAVFMPGSGWDVGVLPTDHRAGKLRLVRDADNVLSGYCWDESTQEWVLIHSRQVSGDDLQVVLHLWGDVLPPRVVVAFDNFQVNSGEIAQTAPVIEDVVIDRGRSIDRWDWAPWHQRFTVRVKGTEYEQPASLLIEDMQGSRYVISTSGAGSWYDPLGTNPGGSSDVRVTAGPDYTYTYTWYEARKEYAIPEGSYRISVIGTAGSWPALVTPVIPAVSDQGPVLLAPAADGIVDPTTPTFEWTPLPGWAHTLQLRAEGAIGYTGPLPEQDDCGQIWRAEVGEQASAVYNFDGAGPDLEPGRTYFWQVNAWSPVDDRVTDPRVSVWNEQTARHRFTVNTEWPALPALPGKLAYEQTMYGDTGDPYNLQAILQYGTTPAERQWIGPEASHTPSYSWDGTKLAYRLSDFGIRVANADGSDPVQVPAMWAWYGAEFSPDASAVTYVDSELRGVPPLHIYTQKLFGPERTLLVENRGIEAWSPHWSPDGVWISYLSCCDPSGNYVWLIHPDGTDDHPLLPTGVAGHPGATITWFAGTPAWSPDAKRLGVGFTFTTAGGASLTGIGTMSREGGEIAPVWINPPDVGCCAAAGFQAWSPNGNSVVFTSAHHLPVDPEWANGKFEPGVELWLANADGTGEPTRLTYDYSHNPSAAWWAPNTLVGKAVLVVKGEASLTFAQVTAEGSTRMNVTADLPGPAPAGYSFVGSLWNGATTASSQGSITVALKYDESLVGREDALALMQWNPVKGKWQEITVHPIDTVNRLIRGQCKTLTTFAIAVRNQP